MAAAVVELNTLADAVGTTSEDKNLLLIGGINFIVTIIGRVHVRSRSLELGSASINTLHGRGNSKRDSRLANLTLGDFECTCDLDIAETAAFHLTPILRVQVGKGVEALEPLLSLKQIIHLAKEPGVERRDLVNLLSSHARHESFMNGNNARRVRHRQSFLDRLDIALHITILGVEAPARKASLERTEGLVEGLLPRAADSHCLADGLHLGRKDGVGAGELLESKSGDLGNHVVDRRLEACRRLEGNVIGNTVKGAADGELGSHLSDGETRRLGRQRRGSAHTRIHLDDHELTILGVDCHLYIRTTALDTDLADDVDRSVTEALILLVSQGLSRSNRDGIAGVHAHRIEVLDGAHDHDIISQIAHHLKLILLPAEKRLLNEYLSRGGGVQAAGHDVFEFLHVVSDATTGATEGERWADDQRKGADVVGDLNGFIPGVGSSRRGRLQADLFHGLLEELTVLSLVDRIELGTDQLYTVLLENSILGEGLCEVERRLATHGGQEGVRLLLDQDLFDELGGHGADVSAIRRLGISHDSRRVRVEQHDLVTLSPGEKIGEVESCQKASFFKKAERSGFRERQAEAAERISVHSEKREKIHPLKRVYRDVICAYLRDLQA